MAPIPDKSGLHFDRPNAMRDTKDEDMKPVEPAHDHEGEGRSLKSKKRASKTQAKGARSRK